MGGGSVAGGFPNQRTSNSFYGDHDLPKLGAVVRGRRTMRGGPLLPRLPHNPFAIKASRIGRALNTPAKWPPDDTL
jgi:hypothetical protein